MICGYITPKCVEDKLEAGSSGALWTKRDVNCSLGTLDCDIRDVAEPICQLASSGIRTW